MKRVTRGAAVELGRLVVAAWLLSVMPVMAQQTTPRLLVLDLPYARVWEGTVRAFGGTALSRASDGVIETARAERAPLPDEPGFERIAERVTVRVDSVADLITRVTVTVEAEALKGGSWRAIEPSPTRVRAVLDRIRASIG